MFPSSKLEAPLYPLCVLCVALKRSMKDTKSHEGHDASAEQNYRTYKGVTQPQPHSSIAAGYIKKTVYFNTFS